MSEHSGISTDIRLENTLASHVRPAAIRDTPLDVSEVLSATASLAPPGASATPASHPDS